MLISYDTRSPRRMLVARLVRPAAAPRHSVPVPQGCNRREGTSGAAPEAVGEEVAKAVGGVTVGYKCH